MSLVKAELQRFAKRRVTRWLLALVLSLMAIVVVVVAANHQQPGPAAVAAAEAQAALEFAYYQEMVAEEIAHCEQAAGTADAAHWPEDCEEIHDWWPTEAEMVSWFMPPAFSFRANFPPMITVLVSLLAMFAFLVGASFVGAEWRSGSMMNLLLWQPRRLQVFGAKLGALLSWLGGLGVALGAVWTGAFWLVATYRGFTSTMNAGAWQSIGLTGLRGWALVLVAGAAGFALASLGRHTAMALGGAIAAFVVAVGGVAILFGGMLQVSFIERWLWPTYLVAWMEKSVVLEDWAAPCVMDQASGECVPPTLEITWQVAGLGIGAAVVLLLGAAAWQMRRRDVT